MQIQVDTREHKAEWERIQKQFDSMNVKYFRSKMYVGDYQSLDNPRLVIDRKKIYRNCVEMYASSTNVSRQNLSGQYNRTLKL